jgi:hypothetical protein
VPYDDQVPEPLLTGTGEMTTVDVNTKVDVLLPIAVEALSTTLDTEPPLYPPGADELANVALSAEE